jgi:hypothetical protein
MDPKKVVLMCTGSQGEPSSIIGRLSAGTNRHFDLKPGDTVVLSSHPIPGNEESVSRAINRMMRRGADVIYDAIAPIHVSGHASQEEQNCSSTWSNPRISSRSMVSCVCSNGMLSCQTGRHPGGEHPGRRKRRNRGTGRRQAQKG